VDSAPAGDVSRAMEAARVVNPSATLIRAKSPVVLEEPEAVKGKRVLVVEDGPTITHGGMPYGAGHVAALSAGAGEIIDPRAFAPPEIAAVFAQYPHIQRVLPAMGYSEGQLEALRETIRRADAEVVVAGTPIDLSALLDLDRPVVRARYQFEEADRPGLGDRVDAFLAGR
jgi:predicted GTPase